MFDPDLFELENNDFINFFSDEPPSPPEELPESMKYNYSIPEAPKLKKYNYSIPEAPKLKKRKRGCFYIHKGIKRYWNGKEFLCEHKRQKTRCIDCGGEGFC